MQAVILAGGLGTRLWPLTIDTPKPLLPVLGRPLLAHLVARLPAQVDEVLLAVSFQSEKVRQWVEAGDDPALAGRNLRVVEEDPPVGTGGALANLRDTAGLGAGGGPVVVQNGDLVTDMDLEGLLAAHRAHRAAATIMLVEVEDPSRFGVVELGEDWQIRRFVEKPSRRQAPSNWANAGAYVLDPKVVEEIPAGRPVSLEREIFPVIAKGGAGMRGVPHRGLWVDCGTRESYLEAHRALLKRDPRSPGNEASYFGVAVDVAKDARIERSVLHDRAKVGKGARVKDCVVGEDAVIEEGCVVERSLIAAGARVSAGSRLAGARVVRMEEGVR